MFSEDGPNSKPTPKHPPNLVFFAWARMFEYDMFEEVPFENEKPPLQGNQMIQDCVQKMVAWLQSVGDGEHKQIDT